MLCALVRGDDDLADLVFALGYLEAAVLCGACARRGRLCDLRRSLRIIGRLCGGCTRADGPSDRCGADERKRATCAHNASPRSEEHTSAPQSLMRISYAVFCLK